jgi:tetratricopeptide (TPR) repeat protein
MESTFVPLELFFEHRNYLPAMFMFWPFAVWLTDNRGRWPRLALGMLIIAIVAGSTWSSAKVWGNLRQQALIWGKTNPDSARAQAFAASVEMAYQHYPQAIERLQTASAKQPDEVQLTLNLVDAECAIGGVSPTTWKRALYSLQHTTNGSHAVFDWYTDAIRRTQSNTCPSLSLQNIEDALQASRSNPIYGKQYGRRQDYAHIAGLIDLAKGQPQEALNSFNTALLTATDRGVALEQAAILGSDGYPALGLRHLAFAQVHATDVKPGFGMPLLHDWILTQQGYWQHETQVLHDTLAEDAAERQKKPNPSSD